MGYMRGACDYSIHGCASKQQALLSPNATPEWRNWYTHQTQNLARSHSCRFESDLRHHHNSSATGIQRNFTRADRESSSNVRTNRPHDTLDITPTGWP